MNIGRERGGRRGRTMLRHISEKLKYDKKRTEISERLLECWPEPCYFLSASKWRTRCVCFHTYVKLTRRVRHFPQLPDKERVEKEIKCRTRQRAENSQQMVHPILKSVRRIDFDEISLTERQQQNIYPLHWSRLFAVFVQLFGSSRFPSFEHWKKIYIKMISIKSQTLSLTSSTTCTHRSSALTWSVRKRDGFECECEPSVCDVKEWWWWCSCFMWKQTSTKQSTTQKWNLWYKSDFNSIPFLLLVLFSHQDILPTNEEAQLETREFLQKIIDILLDYVNACNDRNEKILEFHHPEDMVKLLDLEIGQAPVPLQQLVHDCATTMKYQVKTGENSYT